MAGINPDISTSSFKPLSLDEIMMVPLAKQQQENTAQLALDEFAALESNSLSADNSYVSGQIGAFKKEAGSLSDQLMSNGVDGNLINKVRGLRNRKTNELSLTGKTGQASAAYNQYKANEANIMKDPRLTADQKRLGMQEALTNYKGVEAGGQYQDYIGAAHIGIQEAAYKIADKMSPQEIAAKAGVVIGEDGYYHYKGYITKTLPAELIEKVVRQALEGDKDLMAYAQEKERLGISTVDEELTKAAANAGNVFQRKDVNDTSTLLPGNMQINSNNGIPAPPAPGQNWDSYIDIGTQGAFNNTLGIPSIKDSSEIFNEDGDFLSLKKGEESLYENEDITKSKKILADSNKKGYENLTVSEKRAYNRANSLLEYYKTTQDVELNQGKAIVELVKKNNPAFTNSLKIDGSGYTDKEIYDIYIDAKKRSSLTASQNVFPKNPENTFYEDGNRMIGSDGSTPSIISRNVQMMTPNGTKGGYAVMMKELGYSNDATTFQLDLKSGKADSYSPGVPGTPGARKITFYNSKEKKFSTMYAEPSQKEADAFKNVENINSLINSGEPMKKLLPLYNGAEQYSVAELMPETGRYEGGIITAQPGVKLTQDDISGITYIPAVRDGITIPGVYMGTITTGEFEGQKVFKKTLEAEVQSGIDKINRYYDTTRNAKTNAKEGTEGKQQ